MTIPVMRLSDVEPGIVEETLEAIREIADAGAFTMGPPVEEFEADFARFCGTEHCLGVSSGTEALVLALRALGVGPGDEVVVPANSFIATAEAVTLTGALPRFADVDPHTQLVTADTLERRITARTRCLMPVHLYGAVLNLQPILELARDRGLAVVEDACQAHGARYGERRAGALGDLGCFSFYPTKNLGAWGDGGAVVTSDPELAERVRLLRAHGEGPRYHHRMPGTTARLDAIQAAVLRIKLRGLEADLEARRRHGSALRAALRDAPVECQERAFAGADHVYHLFVVRSRERDALRAHLGERGVSTAVHYPIPIHLTDAYRGVDALPGDLPVVETLAEQICSLPLFPSLRDGELTQVAEACNDFRPAMKRLAA